MPLNRTFTYPRKTNRGLDHSTPCIISWRRGATGTHSAVASFTIAANRRAASAAIAAAKR